jgi:hypothetical protein
MLSGFSRSHVSVDPSSQAVLPPVLLRLSLLAERPNPQGPTRELVATLPETQFPPHEVDAACYTRLGRESEDQSVLQTSELLNRPALCYRGV